MISYANAPPTLAKFKSNVYILKPLYFWNMKNAVLLLFYWPNIEGNGNLHPPKIGLNQHNFSFIRDQSIFMGIRDREICNGTTHYFGLLVERGHRLFWGLALRGHGLFQCRIWTGPKIILKYSGMGSWTIFSFSSLFHIKNTGPEQIYTTGLTFISDGDFNGAVENFWPSGYGAMHYFVW